MVYDSHVKMGVNGQGVQPFVLICQIVRVISVIYEGMYGCFVNGVCLHGLAIVETLWRPTGTYRNYCVSMQYKTWEPGVEACELR